ncbi:MAG: CDP-alcohol phosphatidyltransferase family protein [Actinoallomurus sp.]
MVTRVLRRPGVFGRAPITGLGVQLALLVALWSAGVCLGLVGWLAGLAYAVTTWIILGEAVRRSRTRAFGPANGVTLVRATLVGCVTAIVAQAVLEHERDTVLIVIAAVALVLDAVDGKVARRTGTASRLGARFDMEVDAFLILVLSVFVARSFGPWVLAIGAMRYAFVAAGWVLPWLRGPLSPTFTGKAVAVLQGVVLVVAAADVIPHAVASVAVASALACLTGSFGRDVGRLWRARHSEPVPEPERCLE